MYTKLYILNSSNGLALDYVDLVEIFLFIIFFNFLGLFFSFLKAKFLSKLISPIANSLSKSN